MFQVSSTMSLVHSKFKATSLINFETKIFKNIFIKFPIRHWENLQQMSFGNINLIRFSKIRAAIFNTY